MNAANYNRVVPANVVRLIDERGLKQCAVAERAGFTKTQFSDMLNGRRIMKVCDVMAIAEALGVEVGELYVTDQKGA